MGMANPGRRRRWRVQGVRGFGPGWSWSVQYPPLSLHVHGVWRDAVTCAMSRAVKCPRTGIERDYMATPVEPGEERA